MATKKKTAEQAPDSQTVTAAPEQAVTEAEPREEEGGAHVEETTSEVRETSVDPSCVRKPGRNWKAFLCWRTVTVCRPGWMPPCAA